MKKREIQDGRKLPIFIHSELDDLGLDPFEFRIYARLARRAGEHGAFESVPNMAKHCKMSERQVRYSLKTLVSLNLIRKTEYPGKPANYILTDRPEWKSPPEKPKSNQQKETPAPDAPLHLMQPTPAPGAGVPLHHMQPKDIHGRYSKEGESTPPPSPIIELLIYYYQNIATTQREQVDLKNQSIILDAANASANEVKAWLESRRSLSSIGFIARDFKTWRANQARQNHNGQNSQSPPPPRYNCEKCQDRFVYQRGGQAVKCDCWQKRKAA